MSTECSDDSDAEPIRSVTFSARPSRRLIAIWSTLPTVLISWIALGLLARDLSSSVPVSENVAALKFGMIMLGVTFTLLALVKLGLVIRASAPGRNFLWLDERGLTYARMGKSQFWPWPDVSAFGYEDLGHLAPRILFTAPARDLQPAKRDSWVHKIAAGGSIIVIKDVYDAPLDKIFAVLNAYRRYSLGEEPDLNGLGIAKTEAMVVAMPPVSIGTRPGRRRLSVLIWMPVALICGVTIFSMAQALLSPADRSASLAPWSQFTVTVLAVVGVIVAISMLVDAFVFRNYLRIDAEGLTVVRAGRRRCWSWFELSALEREDATLEVRGIRTKTTYRGQEEDSCRPLGREVTQGYPLRIKDIYDRPLIEIMAMIEEYRARALERGVARP